MVNRLCLFYHPKVKGIFYHPWVKGRGGAEERREGRDGVREKEKIWIGMGLLKLRIVITGLMVKNSEDKEEAKVVLPMRGRGIYNVTEMGMV